MTRGSPNIRKPQVLATDFLPYVRPPGRREVTHDLSGRVFGRLTVLHEVKASSDKGHHRRWLTRCDCGFQQAYEQTRLVSRAGNVTRCPECVLKDWVSRAGPKHPGWRGCGELSAAMWGRVLFAAKQRGFVVEISMKEAWELFLAQSALCALTGVPLRLPTKHNDHEQTASLDRVDSSLGYLKGNVQWVHKRVNRMKLNLRESEFIDWCAKVAQHAGRKSQNGAREDFADSWEI